MTDTEKLVAEFLAKGGEIRRMKRGARTEVIPPSVKGRGMMGRSKKTPETD